MKDIAIYCAGGFGKEVYCTMRRMNNPEWNFIGFFDDGVEKGKQLQYGVCLGGINELNAWATSIDVCIANGNPRMLRRISENIINQNVDFPNIIDPSCFFADRKTNVIGKGNILCRGVGISVNVSLGKFNVVNADGNFGHDATVGDFNAFMPGVRISGEVKIGNENFWGFNSGIIQQKTVGNNVTVGAGAVLLRKPKDGCTYVGVPASMVKY